MGRQRGLCNIGSWRIEGIGKQRLAEHRLGLRSSAIQPTARQLADSSNPPTAPSANSAITCSSSVSDTIAPASSQLIPHRDLP